MRGRAALGGLAALLSVALVAPGACEAKTVSHSFDANNQDWLFAGAGTDGPAAWSALAGNPPGSISGTDTGDDSGADARFAAPTAFLGDWTANIGFGGEFSFQFATDVTHTAGRTGLIAIIDTDTPMFPVVLSRDFSPGPSGGFFTYRSLLVASNWHRSVLFPDTMAPAPTAAEFAAVLADVDRVAVLVDVVDGTGETYRLDEVKLTEPPAPATPAAATAAAGAVSTPSARCPKGKKLVRKKGKHKCKRKRKK